MSDATVPRLSRRRRAVLIGLALVTLVMVAVGVIWGRSRHAERSVFGFGPVLQNAIGDMGRSLTDGGAVSAQFVNDLRAGRWHEAYQSTSRRFQQQMDEVGLERFVRESPPIKGPDTPIKFNLTLVTEGASITVSGTETAPDGGVWLQLITEGDALKVDRLALGNRTAP